MDGWLLTMGTTFLPHGLCLSWDPVLLAVHALSDLVMALSYAGVGGCIYLFGRRRPDMGSPRLFNVLATVFFLCALIHLSDIGILWVPAYWPQAVMKAIAAIAAAAAILVMLRLFARALELPSVSQLRAVNAEIRLLSQAVQQSTNAVIITDTESRIEYVNPRFSEISGYRPEEAIGQTPRILKSGFTPPEDYERLYAALGAGQSWKGEFQDRHKDGTPFWVNATVSPVRDEDGRISHFVAMEDDITERKLAEQRMREAHELAEVASRAKSELIANMSHELRTPLNAIIGFSSAMLSGALGPVGNAKHAEYLSDIVASGEHLLSLINDILDVSAIEVGKLKLNEETVSIGEVIGSVVRMVQPRAEQAEVSIDAPSAAPWSVLADSRRLKQIVANLLTNAVKFTPPGGRVTITAEPAEDGLVLAVTDTGIGMSVDELDKAMQPFGQVDSSLARRYEGTGLGLPLTKGLVEAHGGRLEIRTQKGAGTTALVHLPRQRVLAAAD